MKIEINENAGWTICCVALLLAAIVSIGFATKAGVHQREQVIKAKTCEQLAALTGSFSTQDIIMCRTRLN